MALRTCPPVGIPPLRIEELDCIDAGFARLVGHPVGQVFYDDQGGEVIVTREGFKLEGATRIPCAQVEAMLRGVRTDLRLMTDGVRLPRAKVLAGRLAALFR